MSCVYLLHIDPPYQGKKHYIGFSRQAHPAQRFAQHLKGKKGTFTGRAIASGSKLSIVMHWSGPTANEAFERFLKDGMDTKHWCPKCGLNTKPIPSLTDFSRAEALKRAQARLAYNTVQKGRVEIQADRRFAALMRETVGDKL